MAGWNRRGAALALAVVLGIATVGVACSSDSGDTAGQSSLVDTVAPDFAGFADVAGGQVYTTAANWSGAVGIVDPVDGGPVDGVLFAPDEELTTGDAVTWLYRLANDTTAYPDAGVGTVGADDPLAPAVNWAVATGVIDADSEQAGFEPSAPVTLGQLVTLVGRAADEPAASADEALTSAQERSLLDGVVDADAGDVDEPVTWAGGITVMFRSVYGAAGIDDDHDNAVRMNQIQTMGTHNSYRERVPDALFNGLMGLRPVAVEFGLDPYELDYGTRPLAEQFGRLGARQIELDVFADPDGGLYSTRTFNGSPLLGDDAFDVASGEPELDEPGFKVLHIQDLDYGSHCLSFVACLTEVRQWSQANPTHLPIVILVEVKDDELPEALGGFGASGVPPAVPPPTSTELLNDLDDEIRSVFSDDGVITPDSVRVDDKTLRASVTEDGWPTLADSRGKVMFALDNGGPIRDLYIGDRPNLEGRMMFADVGSPDADGAAFFKRNDPAADDIPGLVGEGFVVRTRADGPYTSLLPEGDGDTPAGVETRRLAWASGATWLSSDYLEPTDSTYAYPDPAEDIRGNQFTSFLPAGGVARCNPVAVNPACNNRLLLADTLSAG